MWGDALTSRTCESKCVSIPGSASRGSPRSSWLCVRRENLDLVRAGWGCSRAVRGIRSLRIAAIRHSEAVRAVGSGSDPRLQPVESVTHSAAREAIDTAVRIWRAYHSALRPELRSTAHTRWLEVFVRDRWRMSRGDEPRGRSPVRLRRAHVSRRLRGCRSSAWRVYAMRAASKRRRASPRVGRRTGDLRPRCSANSIGRASPGRVLSHER